MYGEQVKLIYMCRGEYFWDEPISEDDYDDAVMYYSNPSHNCNIICRITNNQLAGIHRSDVSKPYQTAVDTLQKEEDLDDNKLYIVCYLKDNDCDIYHCVDYNISKQQIIDNVIAQRYVEGAQYFYTSNFI